MSEKTTASIAGGELLAQWEGPAEHAPWLLVEESVARGTLDGAASLEGLASWVAVTAISADRASVAGEAIRRKVLDVVCAWAKQQGQARLDELQQHVVKEMLEHRRNGKLTEEEVASRIAAFFDEVRG
jgi:hypothetical protein